MFTRLAAAALTATCLLAPGNASAVTYNVSDGDLICEQQNEVRQGVDNLSFNTSLTGPNVCTTLINPELDEDTSVDDTIVYNFTAPGSAELRGWVKSNSDNKFEDSAFFRGTGDYRFTLELVDYSAASGKSNAGFKAGFRLGGVDFAGSTLVGVLEKGGTESFTTIATLSTLTDTFFSVDASGFTATTPISSNYRLTVQAIPVPAGVLMLLSAFGVAAGVRRLRRAA